MLFSIESANIIKPLIFLVQKSCIFKIKSYLCNAFNKSTSERKFGRGGRVVDCGGLENRCTARYPGFESLSLRWTIRTKPGNEQSSPTNSMICGTFFIPLCLLYRTSFRRLSLNTGSAWIFGAIHRKCKNRGRYAIPLEKNTRIHSIQYRERLF